MIKMIYTAVEATIPATDEFDLCYTFDKSEAFKAAENCIAHLTANEKRHRELFVRGWNVEVEEGATAKEAYNDWALELFAMPDPDFYEAIKI